MRVQSYFQRVFCLTTFFQIMGCTPLIKLRSGSRVPQAYILDRVPRLYTPLIHSDKLPVQPLSLGQAPKAAGSRGRQNLRAYLLGWVAVEEESRGVQTGRTQAGKGRESQAKESVCYPAGYGEAIKGFQCGKNIWYSKLISDCFMECWLEGAREEIA